MDLHTLTCVVILDALFLSCFNPLFLLRLHDPLFKLKEPIAPVNTFKGLITLTADYGRVELPELRNKFGSRISLKLQNVPSFHKIKKAC